MNYNPYTYLIVHKETKMFYYGVKYGKDADPKTFWVKYFTSSKTIKMLIERDGKDAFDVEVRMIFKTVKQAQRCEVQVLRKIINNDKCINVTIGGDAIKSHKNRSMKDKDGLTSYQRAGKKYTITLKNNPDIKTKAMIKTKATMSEIQESGLTKYKENGLKITGDNNPSKKPENRKKISEGNKKWLKENPELLKENVVKMKVAMLMKDENGLDVHDKHSIWMKENNPTSNTVWVNNGKENLRVNEDGIPNGYVKGRIKNYVLVRTERICIHCGKIGKGPNMARYHFDNCKKA